MNPKKEISGEELAGMSAGLQRIHTAVEAVTRRLTQDVVTYEWDNGEVEEVHFTRVWQELRGGVVARALDTISTDVSLVAMTAVRGVTMPSHSHPIQTQTIFVAEGKMRLYHGDKKVWVEANETAIIDKNTRHCIIFYEDTTFVARYAPRKYEEIEEVAGKPVTVIKDEPEEEGGEATE